MKANSKESVLIAAMSLSIYEQKQIAAILITNTLNPEAIKEITAISNQIARDKEQ